MAGRFDAAFDHLVIGAANLDAAAAWAGDTLGAEVPLGGAHPLMGTHNRLARLPVGYLELIAVDPGAPPPSRARWYGLDAPETRSALLSGPRPIAWVVAVSDLAGAVDAARAAGWEPGALVQASRGDLSWRMTVRPDGAVAEGVLPALIEWPASLGGRAPRDRMKAVGLSLTGLTLRAPDRRAILDKLAAVGADMPGVPLAVEDGPPSITAGLSTPKGPVVL